MNAEKPKQDAQTLPFYSAEEGRVLRVNGTRIPIDRIVYAYHQGTTPAELVENFPSLTIEAIEDVTAYYLANREEVDAYIVERERLAEEMTARILKDMEASGRRAKLEALLGRRFSTKGDPQGIDSPDPLRGEPRAD